jgi:hypothetical protein
MALIDNAIRADQGARYRHFLRQTITQCEDAYREDEEPFRSHLGASMIGRECARELWYSFRWCVKNTFEGRMIRLFNRGHLEEARFVAMLLAVNINVWQHDEKGKQFRIVGHNGHDGGSTDGVARGFPEMPDVAVLVEFKTHGEKSFAKLAGTFKNKESLWKGNKRQGGEGVLAAKWEHFVQMQRYMGYYGLPYAYYFAVNKDTDELYVEIVAYDRDVDYRYRERAATIVEARVAPSRIANSIAWHKCMLCDAKQLCHADALPERNCRTCQFSVPVENAVWVCDNPECRREIDKATQFAGCERWTMNPSIKG